MIFYGSDCFYLIQAKLKSIPVLECVTPLGEMALAVIVLTLLKQRSLDPDQVNVLLPHYVPTRCKSNIARHLKMLMCSHDAHYFSKEPVHWKTLCDEYTFFLPKPWYK